MDCKNNAIANSADHAVMIALCTKVTLEPGFRYVGTDRARIESCARNYDRTLVKVRGEDDEAPFAFLTLELFLKKNRQCIRFLASGAARNPDSYLLVGIDALDQGGNDLGLQCLQASESRKKVVTEINRSSNRP
jgi:hypothetical protein